MRDWTDLDRELDAWGDAGQVATFWWRDDDAVVPTPPLFRLLETRAQARVPIALAVIPRDTGEPLAQRLNGDDQVAVLLHGFSHRNHAPDEDRKMEYGPHRPLDVQVAELLDGWSRLAGFTHRRPVFVPPWNRMDDGLLSRFAVLGLTGLSTWGPRPQAQPVPGVTRVNTHIDVVDWAGGRGFVGLDRALSMAIDHLEARRTGAADRDEATGLMTHHLAHDDGCWDFIGTFLARVRDHQAGHWLSAEQAFRP